MYLVSILEKSYININKVNASSSQFVSTSYEPGNS